MDLGECSSLNATNRLKNTFSHFAGLADEHVKPGSGLESTQGRGSQNLKVYQNHPEALAENTQIVGPTPETQEFVFLSFWVVRMLLI